MLLEKWTFKLKEKSNYSIEQRKCKSDEKRDQFLISKLNFIYEISRRNKMFSFWSSFLKLCHFYEGFWRVDGRISDSSIGRDFFFLVFFSVNVKISSGSC